MALALFDLDDTLLDGDSATLWFDYLIETGIAPKSMQEEEHQMIQLYYRGELAMEEYMNFTLQPLAGRQVSQVRRWMDELLEREIAPRLFPQGQARLDWHRERGDRIVLISASGENIVRPIAEFMGINDVIAINLQQEDGCYTGKTQGVLSYQAGKVIRLQEWLRENPHSLEDSFGYSDSINDVPLLETVSNPWAINPAERLSVVAMQMGWNIAKWTR
ncbi:MAG: HAD family hydrolase [Gammaproteobacteria bacterium]|nr:HAD family hydrolase [Gammaproteobacteria bacterium]